MLKKTKQGRFLVDFHEKEKEWVIRFSFIHSFIHSFAPLFFFLLVLRKMFLCTTFSILSMMIHNLHTTIVYSFFPDNKHTVFLHACTLQNTTHTQHTNTHTNTHTHITRITSLVCLSPCFCPTKTHTHRDRNKEKKKKSNTQMYQRSGRLWKYIYLIILTIKLISRNHNST